MGASPPTRIRFGPDAAKSLSIAIVQRIAKKYVDQLGAKGSCPDGSTWESPGIEDVDHQHYVLTCSVEGEFLLVKHARKRKTKTWRE